MIKLQETISWLTPTGRTNNSQARTDMGIPSVIDPIAATRQPIDWYLSDGATSNRRVEWTLPWSLGGSAISDSFLVRVPTANPSAIAVLLQFTQASNGTLYTLGAHVSLTLSNAGALQIRVGTDVNNRAIWEIAGWRAANSGKLVQLHFVSAADTATLPTVYQDGVALSGWVALPPAGTVPNWFAPALSLTFRSSGQDLPNTEFRPGTPINRALTAAEVAQMVQTGALLPVDRPGGSMVPAYTSNFSSGVDGFTAQAGSVVGNADAVSDGTTSYDDCLAYTGSGAGSFPAIVRNSAAVPSNGFAFRFSALRFKYYIPNSATIVQGIRLTNVASGTSVATNYVVKGTWTEVVVPVFAPALNLNNSLVIECWNGVSSNFTHTDTIYIRDVVITSLGALLQSEITRTAQALDHGPLRIRGIATAGVRPLCGCDPQPTIFTLTTSGAFLTGASTNPLWFESGIISEVYALADTAGADITLRRNSSSTNDIVTAATDLPTANVWVKLSVIDAQRAFSSGQTLWGVSSAGTIQVKIFWSRV